MLHSIYWDVDRALGNLRPGARLRVSLRAGLPDSHDRESFLAKARAALAKPIEGLSFYNWGHLTEEELSWIPDALGAQE